MSKVKIGAHYIVTHNRPQDMDFVAACPAPSAKIVYSSTPNADHVREVMRRAPARVVLRDHPLSEQHDDIWRDPEGTGRRHAREWKQHLDEIGGLDFNRILVEGANEFPHWLENGIQTQLIYELAFGIEAQRLGVNTLHCQFPVGWPGNGGIADAPPDWKPWEPILAWIDAHPGTFLAIHEYWGFNTGVRFYAGWWFLRYRKMPHKVPTILTELGGLRARQNPNGTFGLVARDGWKGNDEDKDSGISAEQYLAQWQQAEVELRADPYIDSAHLFTTDGAHPWIEECDAEPVNGRWVQWAKQQTELPTPGPSVKPPVVYIPSLPNDGPTPPAAKPPALSSTIDPAALEAILEVESNGAGFVEQRMVIRFEAHIFARELQNAPLYVKHFRNNDAGRPWTEQFWRLTPQDTWRAVHTGHQDSEWTAFGFARSLNETAAMRAISMGAPQIMGFNHQRIGYPTVQAMFAAFNDGYPAQLIGLINFILSDAALVDAIRRRDWRTVAKLYNGPGQAEVYAARLEKAYREASA